LFRHEGIPLTAIAAQNDFIELSGRLSVWLVCGSFGLTNMHDDFGDSLPIQMKSNPAAINDHHWQAHDADSSGVFDFKNGLVRGPQENCFVYLAVWI